MKWKNGGKNMIEKVGFNVSLVVLRNQLEVGATILLHRVQEGVYELPNAFLGATDTPNMLAESILETVSLDGQEEGISPSTVFGDPNRDPSGHNLAQMYIAQMRSDAERKKDESDSDYVWFIITSHEARVDISTDDTTIILYRDGRVTGDSVLALDHSQMLTTIF